METGKKNKWQIVLGILKFLKFKYSANTRNLGIYLIKYNYNGEQNVYYHIIIHCFPQDLISTTDNILKLLYQLHHFIISIKEILEKLKLNLVIKII